MPLSQGFRLGPYEILTPLGAGGMGEVYKARDTRLGRTVAVKVLPDHLTSPEARERLAREAQAISALSHSHICALYDVGRERATDYLVMEFLEGETLADRISRGALPLAQTLRFGGEIASALDAAHRQGIAHRDLKPANVMLTKSGVKLLDFGLARILKPGGPVANHTSADTEADELTREGTILGTLAYMAPEQIEGKPADARTDIFALGIVIYEMATGQKAFSGTSQALLLSSVLTAEPPAISSRRPDSPAALDRLVRFCLSKDPADRWQSAHDLALELGSIEEDASQAAVPDARTSRNRNRERLAWLVAGTLFVALVAGRFRGFGRAGEALQVTRFLVASPEKSEFFRHPSSNSLALSPDGSSLAFIASTAGTTSLWVRRVDALAAVRLNGTEEAIGPFWSPDGRWLGFFARGKLQKIAVAGGPPQALCDIADGNAATWGLDGTILFAEWEGGREGIQRVSAEGGPATQVTFLERARGERSHAWPLFLPDGNHFLYLSGGDDGPKKIRSLRVGSLGSRQVRQIMSVDSRVAFCSPGYLLFGRDGALLAAPFDAEAVKVTGDPIPVAESVWFFRATGNASFSASENGTVVYQGDPNPTRLIWRDRSGREIGTLGTPALFGRPRVSPDGSSIAVEVADPRNGTRDIWIYDERGRAKRFTAVPTDAVAAVWSPGGDRIAFATGGDSALDIHAKSVNEIGGEQLLQKQRGVQLPSDWSPDGSRIVYEDYSPARSTRKELGVVTLGGRLEGAPLLQTPFSASAARYSPDGGWIAFVSEESGRPEIYVAPASGRGGMRRISDSGGSMPRWRRDGRELFYLAASGDVLAVPTRTAGGFEAGSPAALFRANPPPDNFDVAPDGRRFLFQEPSPEKDVPPTVVVHWSAEFRKR